MIDLNFLVNVKVLDLLVVMSTDSNVVLILRHVHGHLPTTARPMCQEIMKELIFQMMLNLTVVFIMVDLHFLQIFLLLAMINGSMALRLNII